MSNHTFDALVIGGGANGRPAPAGTLPARRCGKDSLPAHAELCLRAGMPCATIGRPGLAFDLDRVSYFSPDTGERLN